MSKPYTLAVLYPTSKQTKTSLSPCTCLEASAATGYHTTGGTSQGSHQVLQPLTAHTLLQMQTTQAVLLESLYGLGAAFPANCQSSNAAKI
jgi:hypothetical protein